MTALVLAVFVAVYVGMGLGRWPGLRLDRTGIAMLGAILLYAAGAVDGSAVLAAMDFPTLVVLFGLMILSAQFAACGFYDWCADRLARTEVAPVTLLALTVAVGGVLSAVLANDVVVFAMTPTLCLGLVARGLDPRPFVIALAGASNAGSAARLFGIPQNILIGEAGRLDFWAFLAACGPPALGALAIVFAVVWWVWRDRLGAAAPPDGPAPVRPPDRGGLAKAVLATLALLVLFATPLPHVTGVLVVAAFLLVSRRLATGRILALVDWPLLVLFAGLFVVTAALAATGLPGRWLAAVADAGFPLDRLGLLAPLMLVGSNGIGNVPLVTLILAVAPPLADGTLYALALLSTLAGNLLIVGSLANIIAVQRARDVGVAVGFMEHARCGIPMTLISMAAAAAWLLATGRIDL